MVCLKNVVTLACHKIEIVRNGVMIWIKINTDRFSDLSKYLKYSSNIKFILKKNLSMNVPRFNDLPTRIKYLKSLFNWRNYSEVFRKIGTKSRAKKNRFCRFWIAMHSKLKKKKTYLFQYKLPYRNEMVPTIMFFFIYFSLTL